jgi:MFS family permease
VVSCFVLSLAIVRDTQTETRAARLIAYVTSAMALAPMVGPMIGGGIDVTLGWRAIFWAYAIAGIGLLLLCLRGLTETAPATSAARRSAFDLLRNPAFLAYASCTAFSTSTFYVFITGTPLVLGTQFDMDAAQIGLGIGSITAGFMAGSFLSGRLADAVPTVQLSLTGRVIACAGLTVGLGLAVAQVITPILFFAATIWVGVGNGLTMPGTNTKAMSIDPSRAGAAAGLSGALTVLLGAVLTQLMGQILGTPYDLPLLIVVMLGTAALGLVAALWARGLAPQARVPPANRSTPPSR